jgi:hypothetical protein
MVRFAPAIGQYRCTPLAGRRWRDILGSGGDSLLVRIRSSREVRMPPLLSRPVRAVASLAFALGACSTENAGPRVDAPASDGSIVTTFDRLTLSPGERSTFRASLVGAGARLSSAGLAFTSKAPSVARVTAAEGRAQVQGVATGRTWVVVRTAAAADSVEVIVQ